jgi:hypothetical protein
LFITFLDPNVCHFFFTTKWWSYLRLPMVTPPTISAITSQILAYPRGNSRILADPSGSLRTLADPRGPSRTLADPRGPSRTLADPGGPSRTLAHPCAPRRPFADPRELSRTLAPALVNSWRTLVDPRGSTPWRPTTNRKGPTFPLSLNPSYHNRKNCRNNLCRFRKLLRMPCHH